MAKRILVIDDQEEYLIALKNLLGKAGYEVMTADNANDGLKTARNLEPDLILCDMSMPGSDGVDVLDIVQDDAKLSQIPFVFLTAMHGDSLRDQALRLGAKRYITKPIDHPLLLNTLAELIK